MPLPESTQLGLLQSTAAIFVGGYSELERGASALQAAIASVNTNFNSLWVGYRPGPTGSNGEAWGITSLVGFEEDGAREEGEEGDVGFLVRLRFSVKSIATLITVFLIGQSTYIGIT